MLVFHRSLVPSTCRQKAILRSTCWELAIVISRVLADSPGGESASQSVRICAESRAQIWMPAPSVPTTKRTMGAMHTHRKCYPTVSCHPSRKAWMTARTVGYRTKAFEPQNLAFYFLIAFGLTWLKNAFFIFGILKPPSSIGEQFGTASGILDLVLSFGPTIAAFLMTAIIEGKPGVVALWRRFWNRNLSIKWLVVALLLYPALLLVANFVSRTLDGEAYPFLNLPNPAWMVIPLFIGAFIFNGMSKEFGWRGYALPRFQAKWNALASSIILGAIWASWHIPSFFVTSAPLYQKNFWAWAPMIVLSSILYTLIFNNTNGSVLAAVLFHAMANTAIIWLPSAWIYYGVLLLAVILIVITFGARNLVRQQPAAVA